MCSSVSGADGGLWSEGLDQVPAEHHPPPPSMTAESARPIASSPTTESTQATRQRAPQPAARQTIWEAHELGTPTSDFEPKAPVSASYRPDSIADGWSTDHYAVRLASVRGYVHRYRGIPRQDDVAVTVHRPTGGIVFAVADGVSAAPQSHIGATVACRAAVGAIIAALDTEGRRVDWQNVVQQTAWQLIEQAKLTLNLDVVDPALAEDELATTLVAGMVMPMTAGNNVSLIQVGDSSAWVLRNGTYQCLLDNKYATDDAVFSSSVTALPRAPQVRPRTGWLAQGSVLLVGTDGFGDPLGDGLGIVGEHFTRCLKAPAPPLQFAYDLDFSRETFDDDRTLLALWSRSAS